MCLRRLPSAWRNLPPATAMRRFSAPRPRKLPPRAILPAAPLYLRQEDLGYAEALAAALPGCRAEASPGIRLGGLIAVSADGRTRLDLSLDAALEGQKQWFFSNSKLDITL